MNLDGYIRVSSTRDREDTLISPELQHEKIAAAAKAAGHAVVKWHSDLDESGTKDDRPGFQDALMRIESGETGGLIVAKLDRFSRSLIGALTSMERIENAGGQFVCVDPSIDTSTATGRMILNVLLSVAQLGADQVRENWNDARRHAVAKGVHIASRSPTGYDRGDDGRLVQNPHAAAVADAFRARAAGASYSEIARMLETAGAVGPYGSTSWTIGAVSSMLRNPVYTGQARSGEFRLEAAHPALVTSAEFAAAQSARSVSPARSTDGHLLSGLVRCAGCRHVMKPDSVTSRGEKLRQYRCRGKHAGGKCPAPSAVLARVIEPAVVSRFFEELGDGVLARQIPPDVEDLVRELEDAKAQLALYVENVRIDDLAVYTLGLDARQARVAEAQTALAESRPPSLPDAHDLRSDWQTLTTGEQRNLLAAGIDAVMVRRGRHLPGRIHVLWTGEMDTDEFPRRGRRTVVASYDFPATAMPVP